LEGQAVLQTTGFSNSSALIYPLLAMKPTG